MQIVLNILIQEKFEIFFDYENDIRNRQYAKTCAI